MAITESAPAAQGSAAPATFDGFISYSHAADDLLAPRLQSGLQRFAKPWWKRRAVRIFRDESSLAANPHLWSSITQALDDSSWFVLLLSEDAASSEWVGKEIEHWTDHKPSDRILPVVTDGTFGWDGDVTGSSVPPALQGVFGEEPRWVDLRFARDEESLDLQNPDFSAAVADIAATIRGVPKDELASEEVKQHRRTVRTAWAAGIALIVLTVAAIVAGVFAIGQRNDARDNAAEAERQAAIAQRNADQAAANAEAEAQARAFADREADRANTNADEATRNAQLAKARELAASAVGVRDEDPELATLLSIEAIHRGGTEAGVLFPEGLISLREAVDANRLVGRRTFPGDGRVDVAFTPDGSGLIITSESDRSVSRFSPDDLEDPEWTYQDLTTNDVFLRSVVRPDGNEIAIIVVDGPFLGDPGPKVVLDDDGRDGSPGRIVLLDASTGSAKGTVDIGGCVEPAPASPNPPSSGSGENQGGYSPNGSRFHLIVSGTDCAPQPGFVDTVIYDTSTWQETRRLSEIDGLENGEISFTADESLTLVHFPHERTELRSYPEFDLLEMWEFAFDFPPAVARISPDGAYFFGAFGSYLDRRPGFWDIEERVFSGWGDRFTGSATDAVFTPEGLSLVFGVDSAGLYDSTGLLQFELHTSATNSAAISSAAGLAATASGTGVVEVWTLENATTTSLSEPDGGIGIGHINPNQIIDGTRTVIRGWASDGSSGVFVVDPSTGSIESELLFQFPADLLSDGRVVAAGSTFFNLDDLSIEWGPLIIWDPDDDSMVTVRDCVLRAGELDDQEFFVLLPGSDTYRDFLGEACPDGDPLFATNVRVGHDGTQFAAVSDQGEIRVWDVATLQVVRTVKPDVGDGLLLFGDGWFLTGGDSLFTQGPVLYAIDAETGELRAELAGGLISQILALSHDGSRLFLMDEGGWAHEYDTTSWQPKRAWEAQKSTARGISISPDDAKLAVSGEDGLVVIWDLNADDPVMLDRIPVAADRVSDIVWIGEDRMGAALLWGGQWEWQVLELSADAVVDQAIGSLVRGFSDAECVTYSIDPCPTLDEITTR